MKCLFAFAKHIRPGRSSPRIIVDYCVLIYSAEQGVAMRPRLLVILAAGLLLVSKTPTRAEDLQTWTPLFNGKDTKGWKTDQNPSHWKVVDGALVGSGDGLSHLFCDRGDLENFHLRVEAKVSARGNSGVYFRTDGAIAKGKRYPEGYEAQICLPGTGEKQLTGSLHGFAPFGESLVEPDQWFTLEVTANGPRITIKVNGRTTTQFTDEKNTFRTGHLGLQQMPGTTVAFRRIDLLEPYPLPDLAKQVHELEPLLLYWHPVTNDNVAVTSSGSRKEIEAGGYRFSQMGARILKKARAGTAPLLLYKRGDGKEYFTLSTDAGKKTAEDAGYKLVGVQGHIFKEKQPGTIPLSLYWDARRRDYFTAPKALGDQFVSPKAYTHVRVEGYAYDPWKGLPRSCAVILCKLGDKADIEPRPPQFFREAFTEAGAGKKTEFDYFRQTTGGHIDLTGTKVFGWYTLPHTSKEPLTNKILIEWGIEEAKAKGADLAPFWTVIAVISGPYGGQSNGPSSGPMRVALGFEKDWSSRVSTHETGHGLGLQHARRARGLTEYGDFWSVMGANYYQSKTSNSPGGAVAFNAFELRRMNCIPPERLWTSSPEPGQQTITLAPLSRYETDGYLTAVIPPAPGSKSRYSYLLEYRRKQGWDGAIPEDTVLVHEDRNENAAYLLSRYDHSDFLVQKDWLDVRPWTITAGQEFAVPQRDMTIKVEAFDAKAGNAKVTIQIGKPGSLSSKLKKHKECIIVNAASGRVLNLSNPSNDFAPVTLLGNDAKDAPQRLWHTIDLGKGDVAIVNSMCGRVLDVDPDKVNRDGTKLIVNECYVKDHPQRVWRIVDAGNGEVGIFNAKSGKPLDIDGNENDSNGPSVILKGTDVKNAPTRRWKLVEVKQP
jgi:hypothetical protein